MMTRTIQSSEQCGITSVHNIVFVQVVDGA
jgi:hypothetical protein